MSLFRLQEWRMAHKTGNEAITVVIEKLTEIVEQQELQHFARTGSDVIIEPRHLTLSTQDAFVPGTGNPEIVEGRNQDVYTTVVEFEGVSHVEKPPLAVTYVELQASESDSTSSSGEARSVLAYPLDGAERIITLPITSAHVGVEKLPSNINRKAVLDTLKTFSTAPTTEQRCVQVKETHQCDQCQYSSNKKHYLKQHVDLVHNSDRPFKCPFCDYAGKRSHSLKEHLIVHSTERPYECTQCNATFRKKGHLTNHIKMHATQKVLVCGICKGSFSEHPDLYAHLRSAHRAEDVYSCELCDYATTVKSNIAMHMQSHGNLVTYKCDVCNFTALHINILNKHLKTHEADSSSPVQPTNQNAQTKILLKCSACGFVTDSNDILKEHMWTHMDDGEKGLSKESHPIKKIRPKMSKNTEQPTIYKCTDCDFTSMEAYVFITHMLSHKAKSPPASSVTISENPPKIAVDGNTGFTHDASLGVFRCMICGYTCDHQRTIKAHIWKHSGHKDVDYPMFQNGPMSIYEGTPLAGSTANGAQFNKTPQENVADNSSVIKVIEKKSGSEVIKIQQNSGAITQNSLAPNLVELLKNRKVDKASSTQGMTQTGHVVRTDLRQKSPQLVVASGSNKFIAQPQVLLPVAPAISAVSKSPIAKASASIAVKTSILHSPESQTQAASSEPVLSAANSPEIVKLILGSPGAQKVQASPSFSDAEKGQKVIQLSTARPETSPRAVLVVGSKRKIQHLEEMQLDVALKKACFEDEQAQQQRSDNVVVQSVVDVYSTPQFSLVDSRQGSPRTVLPSVPAQTESPPQPPTDQSPSRQEELIVDHKEGSAVPSSSEKKSSSEDVEIASATVAMTTATMTTSEGEAGGISLTDSSTLIALLKKGPNFNPACPPTDAKQLNILAAVPAIGDKKQSKSESHLAAASGQEEDLVSKPKAGISSSLLAVIEQLRERSKSESENDESVAESNKSAQKPPTRKRVRSRRTSSEDDTPIESYDKVEKREDGQLRCRLCHYSSASTSLIKQHMKMHKTKKPSECSLCDYVAESSESLQEHMLQHCKVRTYQCKLCPSVFNYKSQLRAHVRAHNEKDPFLCDMCDFETNNPITFRNHMRFHADKKVYKCMSCDTEFADSDELKVHRQEVCKAVKDMGCEYCQFTTTSKEEHRKHLRTHVKVFKCEHCDYTSLTWSGIRNHFRVHVEEKPLKCDLCDFTASSSRSLKSHMKRHVNDQRFVQQPLEQYKCNLCGYVCHHLPSLKSHMWRHASDTNYSYQSTNDIINAAINYNSQPEDQEESAKNATDRKDEEKKSISTVAENQPSDEGDSTNAQGKGNVADKLEYCLVTFRCCQCGFESIDKSCLNSHMKTHTDIIRKTLEINRANLAGLSSAKISTPGYHQVEKVFSQTADSHVKEEGPE